MPNILISIALALLGISAGLFIAWAVVYADRLDERRWLAQERAREARRKAARLRALDDWEAARNARLAELGISEKDDPWEEEPVSAQKLAKPDEPSSRDEGVGLVNRHCHEEPDPKPGHQR